MLYGVMVLMSGIIKNLIDAYTSTILNFEVSLNINNKTIMSVKCV